MRTKNLQLLLLRNCLLLFVVRQVLEKKTTIKKSYYRFHVNKISKINNRTDFTELQN